MGGRGGYSGGSSSGTEASSIGFTKTYESRYGGSVYTEASRIEQANMNKQERAKYNKEHEMCKHLADNGHNVVHLDDRKLSDGSYDILLNGKKAELKSLKGASNIGREGKGAIKKQKADYVVFEFDKIDADVHKQLNLLSSNGIHGYYYKKGDGGLHEF